MTHSALPQIPFVDLVTPLAELKPEIDRAFATIMATPAVRSAQITRLARSHAANPDSETTANLSRGFLSVGIDQIIRLDNDRNFPQNGTLTLVPQGTTRESSFEYAT